MPKRRMGYHRAGGMIFGRFALTVMAAIFGCTLAACSNVSSYVSDSYPHWAGGEPRGLPPRPGTPGYDDFISHKGADSDAAQQAYANSKATGQGNPLPAPQPSTAPPAAAAPPADNDAVSRGGLY